MKLFDFNQEHTLIALAKMIIIGKLALSLLKMKGLGSSWNMLNLNLKFLLVEAKLQELFWWCQGISKIIQDEFQGWRKQDVKQSKDLKIRIKIDS